MSEHCPDHENNMKCVGEVAKSLALLQKDIEYLRRDQETILARFGRHVEDAEKEGGRHDRLNKAEAEIEAIKTQRRQDMIMSRWFMIGTGIVSGGVVSGAIKIWAVLSRALGV